MNKLKQKKSKGSSFAKRNEQIKKLRAQTKKVKGKTKPKLTLETIAQRYKITRERVRQICAPVSKMATRKDTDPRRNSRR